MFLYTIYLHLNASSLQIVQTQFSEDFIKPLRSYYKSIKGFTKTEET